MKNNLFTLIRYLCRKLVSSFISLSRKVVPYVMVIAFVFTAPDFSFLRKYIRNQIETVFNLDENTDLIDMKNAYEVTELRTENSKTFKKDNDSFEMVLYSDDVHYLTDNGSFLEIDNNLTKSGSAYKNNANRYSVEFPDLINSSKTKISYKDNHLEWKFNFSLNSKAQSKNNLIRYENVTEDIDIEYLVLNDRIKENLIVKKYIEDFSFSYSIFTELKLVREDNVINLFNKDNELIFTINDYYMFDSNENYSYDLKTTITEIKTNEYLITVTPDNQYLQKAAYPLTIDPEIIINYVSESGNIEYKLFDEDGMHDEGFTELMLSTTRICSICGGDGYYTGYEMCTICNGRGYTVGPDRELILCPYCSRGQIPVEKVCTNCIGIIDPTTLFYKLNFFASPALSNLKNCNFLYAYTNFHTNSTKGNGVVNARKLSESDWQRNDLTGYTSSGDIISSVRFNNNSSFTHQFDLYDYFFENINKFGTNFSLCFELDIEAGTNSYVEYDSPGLSSVEVVIGYSNEAGLQDYYTYEEVVSSNSATSYVAHNSGNLISIFSDYSDNNLINLAHVYNSNRNHLLSSYGYGFSLNFDESITEVTPTILKLTKGDKSTVDFILQDGEYIAKDGSGERITIHDSGKYSLLTRDNQLKVYNLNKKLAIIYPDADDITDSVEISYNSSNNIAYIQNFIIDPLNLTSYIRTYAQFNYNYNLLTSIVFSRADENKVLQPVEKISYEYTIYNLTKIKKYCYNTNTTYEICNFTYLPKSITIQDNITNGVKFSFDDANRVKKINALIPNVAEENSPSLDFSFDKQGRRLSISDSEDYQVIYTFDSYFRTKSVMDSLGYTTFTEYKDIFFPGGVYTTDPKYDQNHKVISSSVPFNNTYNLVNNHSFELGDSPLYWTGSNQMIVKEFLYLYGKRALCITSSSTSGASSYQNLKVKAGRTYTVTGYIKNENDSGEGAYIDVTSNYITIDSRSESIKDSDNYHLYSLTFTANSDATVTLRLWNKSIGNAYFDAIQVNDSSVNTRYNYLQNSSFEYSSGWNNSPDYINNDVFDISLMGDKCAKIRNKTITQTIDISGEAGDVLIFGGFAYLENVNARGKIRLKIKYQDETEVFEFTYDPSDANIQYLMKKAEAEYDYTQITLEIENSSTYDYLYLDNLAIYIEGYGLEIEYYDDGQIKNINNGITDSTIEYYYYGDSEGGKIRKIKEGNVTIDFSYDGNQKWIEEVLYNNVKQRYKVDDSGNITEFSLIQVGDDKYKSTTCTTYSPDKLYIKETKDEYDRLTVNTYDYLTGLLKDTTYNGVKTSYSYNEFGDVIDVKTDLKTIKYEYVRRKLSKIIIDGLVYEFVYNSYGDIELIKIAGVTILNNVYQNSESGIYNGLIDNTTYGVDVIRYTYDDEKRIKETYVNEVKINEFTYDSSGNIGKLIDYKTNTTYYYSYDSQNRLVSVKSTDGNNVGYEYVDGDLVRHTNINGQTEYIYLGEEKYLYSEEFDGFSITYYPEDGLLRKVDSIGIGNSNGYIYKKFIYDEFEKNIDGESRNYETNRIKEVNYKKNDGTYIGKLIYGYDSFDDSDCFGNIQKISRFNGSSLVEVEEFEYDIYNQLEFYRKENYRFNKFEEYSYTYDKRGNINTILKEIYNDDNGTYDSYLITYQYKQSGWVDELISVSINGITYTIGDYDIHGNPHTYFGYDISYEQRSITQLSKGSNTYNYSYNSSGIRISKNVNGLITNYVLDGNKIIRETRDGVDLRYFYDISGDIIAFSYNGDYYYYLKNLQNDIIAIADENGNIVGEYSYDAYGRVELSYGTIAQINPFRFKSYYYDVETSFYYCNSRYYDPLIGRWINADTIRVLGLGETNLYTYCNNNPAMNVDPSGNFPILIALAAAFVIAAGSSVISQGIQYGWNEISLVQVGVDGLFAVASVALATTGIGFWASVGIGATMGLGQYAIASGLHDEQMTWRGALLAVGIGAAVGALSGAGARNFKSIAKALDEQQIAKTGVRAVTTAANRYAAGEISKKGLQGVLNIYGRSTVTAIQVASKSIIAHSFSAAATKILIASGVAPFASYYVNKGLEYLFYGGV